MESVMKTLENAIGRAEEYRLLTNHSTDLRIHIEYIRDLIESLLQCGYKAASPNEDRNEVLASALETLENLRSEVAADEFSSKPASISDLRAELETNSSSKLPSFDSTNDIEEFIQRFSSVVMDRVEIRDVIKLIVLKNCLKGVAYDLVNVLPTSAKNFQFAICLLKSVYSDKACIIEQYHTMVALPQVSSTDGLDFRWTFWELEKILKSMMDCGYEVDDKPYLRLLYLQKFREATVIDVLTKDPDMSLTKIKLKIGRMVFLQLDCQNCPETARTPDVQNNPEKSSGDPENATNQPKKGADKSIVPINVESPSGSGTINIEGIVAKFHAINVAPVPELSERADESDGIYVDSWTTVCPRVSYRSGGKIRWSEIRLVIQNRPPLSLLTESAAKRLGIDTRAQKKIMTLRSGLGERIDATKTEFKLTVDLGNNNKPDDIKVHIIDDSVSFAGHIEPARSVAEFKKEHPDLTDLELPDTGDGRPVELFLAGKYAYQYLKLKKNLPKLPCPKVKKGWTLTPSAFGFLVGGRVKVDPASTSLQLPYLPFLYE